MDPNNSGKRPLKRKRYEPPEEELSVRIVGKLHHEKREVHKAAKKARIFETQKVVKRLKSVRQKDDMDKAIEGLEGELVVLKEIDHDAVGNTAFRSKLLKDHALRDHEDVKNAISKELESNLLVPAEPGSTMAKIQSRLLSSKILAAQVTTSMTAIKILLNPALKQREKSTESITDLHSEAKSSKPQKTSKNTPSEKLRLTSLEVTEGHSDAAEDDAGWESGSIDDGNAGADGWESGSIDGEDEESERDDDDASESGDESESDNEDLKVQPVKKKAKAPESTVPKGSSSKSESTFLPSLSVGFIRGSDESDWSETEGKAADLPRKNRRGQRARRAIWEKKFGRNANHKKKEAADLAAAQLRRNKGRTTVINTGANAIHSRDPQVPSVQNKGAKPAALQQPIDAGWGSRSGRPATNKPVKSSGPKADKHAEKPLHPSWEAKRKLKEKESVGIVPSQGTKIKFS